MVNKSDLVITHIFWTVVTKWLISFLTSSALCKAELYQSTCKEPPKLMGNHQIRSIRAMDQTLFWQATIIPYLVTPQMSSMPC